jgi:hypothetical protein
VTIGADCKRSDDYVPHAGPTKCLRGKLECFEHLWRDDIVEQLQIRLGHQPGSRMPD